MTFTALSEMPTTVLVSALLAMLLVAAIALALVIKFRRALQLRKVDRREQVLREGVAQKASQSGVFRVETEDDLSDSGVSSVIQMMNSLVKQGDLEMAEKWALNAIKNHRGRSEIPLKLAEIYYRSGKKARFVAISQYLHSHHFEMDERQSNALRVMGRRIAPDHPLFSKSTPDASRSEKA